MNAYAEFLKTAVDAARAAGRLALSMQQDLKQVRFKGEKDPVTEADLACDDVIRGMLTAAYPGHDLVTEESAALRNGSAFTWFVDPIDGTVNYSRGFPLWGVSVGLREGKRMIAGAIYLPALEELYTAALGGGAFLNGRPIRTSAVRELHHAIVSHGDFNVGANEAQPSLNRRNFAARMRTVEALQRVKCLGSSVVEGSYVAAGRMEGYCMLSMKPWDVAVNGLLVAEAGGTVTALDGSPFDVEGPDALFSNGVLHDDLLALLREDDG